MKTASKKRHFLVNLFVIPILLLLYVLFVKQKTALAVVELVSFTATSKEGGILIEWETATEFNTLGFFLKRSHTQPGEFEYIFEQEAMGDFLTGYKYEYLDTDVVIGSIYYYQLEEIEADQSYHLYGPISAIFGPTNTPSSTTAPTSTSTSTSSSTSTSTPTKTSTRTNTPTRTATGPTSTPSVTATRTPTLAPTRTSTPSLTQSGITLSQTASPSATLSLTTTPTITPTPTSSPSNTPESLVTVITTEEILDLNPPTVTPSPSPTPLSSDSDGGFNQSFANLVASRNFLRISLVLLVIIVWGVLALGFYLYRTSRESE